MQNKKAVRIAVCLAAFLVLACAAVLLWLNGAFLPRWITWNGARTSFTEPAEDAAAEGSASGAARTYSVSLAGKRVTIENETGEVLYTSPRSWFVSDLILYDIDSDGAEEALLLVWKRGSYDRARPFWVKHDEACFSQHIFIFRTESGTLSPLWMSSKLGISVRSWEIDSGGLLALTDTKGTVTRWYWNYWGLTLLE